MKMTNKQAKAYIEDLLHMAKTYTFIFSKETVKSLELAVKALDIQIPHKVNCIFDGNGDFVPTGRCPSCNDWVSAYMDEYSGGDRICPKCGQQLDWGETHE